MKTADPTMATEAERCAVRQLRGYLQALNDDVDAARSTRRRRPSAHLWGMVAMLAVVVLLLVLFLT